MASLQISDSGDGLQVWRAAAKLNGMLPSIIFKSLIRKENVSNVRKGNDILQLRRTRILDKLNK
jgi:hypothetical protein